MCATGSWIWHHHGIPGSAGNATALIFHDSASTITVPYTPFTDGAPLYVRIDSSGVVHTGEPVPDDAPGCASYAIRNAWS